MTVRFGNYRLFGYVLVLCLAGTVLGISARFAQIFLPSLHHDFTIFSLIVPAVTILLFLLMLQWAQPTTEALQLFVLGVLWLTMAAWSSDIIGHVQCDAISGSTRTPTNTGTISAREYCYEMKVLQAFSWALFVLFALFLAILLTLVSNAQALGRPNIWYEPIRELPWFGEWPGYYNTGGMGGYGGYPMMPQYPGGAQYVQSIPGQSLLIQPGPNGQPASVTPI